jgi:hypothetical protein
MLFIVRAGSCIIQLKRPESSPSVTPVKGWVTPQDGGGHEQAHGHRGPHSD